MRRLLSAVALAFACGGAAGYLFGSGGGRPARPEPERVNWNVPISFWRTTATKVESSDFKPYGVSVDNEQTFFGAVPAREDERWIVRVGPSVYVYAEKLP